MEFTIKNRPRGLCGMCAEATVAVTEGGVHLVRCDVFQVRILSVVVECSSYHPVGSMDRWEMKKAGWVMEQKGEKIGFRPPPVKHPMED